MEILQFLTGWWIQITESEQISDNVKSRCIEQGIDYFRLSPNLDVDEIIDAGETDSSKLIEMVVTARKCSIARKKIEDIEERFPRYSDANQKMLKQLQLQKTWTLVTCKNFL